MVPNQVRSRHESLVTMWWSLKSANDFIHRKFNTSGGFNMPIFSKLKICIYCMQTTCQNIMNKCSAEQMTGAYSSGPKNPAAVFFRCFVL